MIQKSIKSFVPIFVALIAHFPMQGRALTAEPLPLDEAVSIALAAGDPSIEIFNARAGSLTERATSESQFPDPRVRMSLANLPIDTWRFSQEPMTQAQIGVTQSFPRGDTRYLMQSKRNTEAEGERTSGVLRQLEVIRDTRLAWLDMAYWQTARETLTASRHAITELVEVTRATFASGQLTAQNVLRAQLELSLVEDRIIEIDNRIDSARAALARFIGADMASRPLALDRSTLPAPLEAEDLRGRLPSHPSITINDLRIAARTKDVDLAEQQYKPGWSIEMGYATRAAGRPDFASVGLSFDLPIFPAKRQDSILRAAQHDLDAAKLDRDVAILELGRAFEQALADYARTGERIALYQNAVNARATWTLDAARGAYRSGISDFDDVVQAQLTEIDTALKLERLRTDHRKAQALLLFFQGGLDE